MEQLKRVFWKVGQPLLPRHLVAQEDAVLAHALAYFKNISLPYYGIGLLKWDDTLLAQGVISISRLTVIFPSGEIVEFPGNGKLESIDLNKTGKTRVSIYLHLLSSQSEEEDYVNSDQEYERIVYAIQELELSDDQNAPLIKAALKLGEFERDLENRWKLNDEYIPPLLSVHSNPFFRKILLEIKNKLEQFQNSIEVATTDEKDLEGQTLETRLSLLEISKMKRLLLNIEHHLSVHPYHLYEALSNYLNAIAVFYRNQAHFELIPYQHEKLRPLFSKMMDELSFEGMSDKEVSHIGFEKKDRCYVSDKLPEEIREAKEIYLILQKTDKAGNPNIESVKLSAHSRLMNTVIFGVEGIHLIRIERAPFNHNFSKRANIYSVERGVEWDYALKERRLAFDYKNHDQEVQAFLYWR